MNIEKYIANKTTEIGKKSFTRWIVKIAVITIALSLSVMILSDALMRGFQHEISQKIFGFWGHIHVMDASVHRTFEVKPITHDSVLYNKIRGINSISYKLEGSPKSFFNTNKGKITSKGGIQHIQKYAHIPGIISTKKYMEGIFIKGVGADYRWEYLKSYLEEGDILDIYDENESREILISRYSARRLNLKTGEAVIIYFVLNDKKVPLKFIISGIYNTGLEEYDKKFAIVNIEVIQKLMGWSKDQIGGYEIFVDDIDDMKLLSQYLYIEELPVDMYAETIIQQFPNIFEWLKLQSVNEWVILILMLAICIINMITTILILILGRTHMIGLLKSMGMLDLSIQKIFMHYAFRILVKGLFWGNLIGIGLAFLQKQFGFIRLNEADYYLSEAPMEINIWIILLLNVGVLLVTLITLIIPSFLIGRIDPIKALRFD